MTKSWRQLRRERHPLVVLCVIGGLIWACGRPASGVRAEEGLVRGTEPATRDQTPSRLLGTASCAAAACHGGIKQANGIGAEYSVWLQNDSHARAYSVLLNDLSKQMAELLQLPKPAHESAVCLNCHSPTTAAALAGPSDADVVASVGRLVPNRELPPFDGVGCEQCHGPGEKWVETHVRKDWKTRSSESKRQLGFRETKDLLVRSRACAECHVGAPGRDVNHDLIAAGHPRLFFEMSAFHNNLPKHWRSERGGGEKNPEGTSQFEAKLWAVGQLATADAAVKLLDQRAGVAEKHLAAAWPELAEWNCFACHHDLKDASWRQARTDAARAVSKPLWNSWPLALIDLLPDAPMSDSAASARKSLAELRPLMNRPDPSKADVRRLAMESSRHLRAWAELLNGPAAAHEMFGDDAITAILKRLSGETAERALYANWDSAAQVYLGLSALTAASRAGREPTDRASKLEAVLKSQNETLNFPDGFQSPKHFGIEPLERLRSDLKRFRETLGER